MLATKAGTLSREQAERYDAEGYLLVPGLFAPDEVAEIRDTFMRAAANGPVAGVSNMNHPLTANDPLARYPRMLHPHRHPELPLGPLALRFLLEPRVEGILRRLFGEEPLAAQSMFYFKPPGARGQALHQDNFYLRVKPGSCMAAWTAVDDAGPENGGLVVVPGSHHHEVACPQQADSVRSFTREYVPLPAGLRETPLNLRAGDVLFFNGSLIHGSSPNSSRDRFRRAFICHYLPASSAEISNWYRPLLNFRNEEVFRADAAGGGPCGDVQALPGPH